MLSVTAVPLTANLLPCELLSLSAYLPKWIYELNLIFSLEPKHLRNLEVTQKNSNKISKNSQRDCLDPPSSAADVTQKKS